MQLAEGWLLWNEITHEALHQKEVCRKVVRRMLLRTVTAAWQQWRCVWDQARSAQRNAKRAVKRLVNGEKCGAFLQWRNICCEVRETKFRMQGILKRLVMGGLVGAWNSWKWLVQQSNERKNTGRRVLMRLVDRKRCLCFMKWRSYCQTYSNAFAIANNALRRLANKEISAAFYYWQELAEELGSWQFSLATAHWAIWNTTAAVMRWRVGSMQQQVSHGWWDKHSTRRASWTEKLKMLKLFDRAMVHCKSHEAAVAYNGWLGTMRNGREQGLLEMWGAVWNSVQKVRFGISKWRFNASALCEAEAISICAQGYWANKVQFNRFTHWHQAARFKKRSGRINNEVHARVMNWVIGNLHGCWKQWKQVTAFKRAENVLVSTATQMWQHKQFAATFDSWMKTAKGTKRVITSLHKLEGEQAAQLPIWPTHKRNWGMQVAMSKAPKGVGGLAYASASLADHDRDDWAETMSRVYLGINSPAAYRRHFCP